MDLWRKFLIGINIFFISILVVTSNTFQSLSPKGEVDLESLEGNFSSSETRAIFNNQIIEPFSPLAKTGSAEVLGDTSQNKRIEIDLTNQRIYAYEGNRQVYNFLVSTGKWGRTPTGIFKIWIKLRYTKMEGGSKALRTYYYLPNVPYVMYFYNNQIPKWRGYGIHGTYWHSNFGHPMSHGCINMKTEEVALLYQWAQPDLKGKGSIYASEDNPGTTIIIYGKSPSG